MTMLRDLFARPFVRSVATFQVGNTLLLLTGLLSSILYTRLLGVAQYGMFAVVSSFAGLLGLLAALGQETTLVTFLSEAVGRRDEEEIRTVLRYFLRLSLLAALVYLLLALLAPTISTLTEGERTIGTLARLLLLNAALQHPAVLLFLTLQLCNRAWLVASLENVRAVAQLTIATIFLLSGYGIEGILSAFLIVSMVFAPLCVVLYEVYRSDARLPGLVPMIRTLWAPGTGRYVRQGLWIAADRAISSNLYPNLFILTLHATATLEVVGLVRLALRLSQLPAQLLMPSITRVSAVSVPRLVGSRSRGVPAACVKLIGGSAGLMLAVSIGAAILIPPLLPLIYGEGFAGAIPIVLLLLPHNVIVATHVASVPLLRTFHRVGAMVVTNASGVLLGLTLYVAARSLLSPGIAIVAGILYYHVHSLLLFAYLAVLLHRAHGGPLTHHA